jgi:hypothetical protein
MTWTLVIDTLGRPLLTNRVHRMHPQAAGKIRREWRDHATVLARAQRIPHLTAVAVTVQARYRTRTGSDCDAPAPAVKGVIDGLVLAGVIPDDGPAWVHRVTYLACEVGTGLPDALIVTVEEVA